jgi:hypothetical protein
MTEDELIRDAKELRRGMLEDLVNDAEGYIQRNGRCPTLTRGERCTLRHELRRLLQRWDIPE